MPSTVTHHGRTSLKSVVQACSMDEKPSSFITSCQRNATHQRCRILQTKDHHNVYILISLPFCCHCRFCQFLHTLANNVGQTMALSAHLPRELKEISFSSEVATLTFNRTRVPCSPTDA